MREEEIKNRLRADFFGDYDATPILGNIDFAVAVRTSNSELFEREYHLWAESKKGTSADIYESFVQLILTIGKARTFDHHLPPSFLGAFDAEKIAFIPYNLVVDIFYQNDFNWKVTPSDHTTREFRQVLSTVSDTLRQNILMFHYRQEEKELKDFIRKNFRQGKTGVSRVRINKNNFTHIYQKWLREVKPSININWEVAKQEGLIDADFYLADILSEHDVTLKEKLFVLLRDDRYFYNIQRRSTGSLLYESVDFSDNQTAHKQFWNRYRRPPKREYWDYIVERRDLLVPQDVRERKGSYFTPKQWVELSQQYLADELGEDWQDEYYIWDCAAGTGNLLNGLTHKFHIFASTLDNQDVKAMHDLIQANSLNLLESHVFQFDFLNDPFTKLPKTLQDIINDPERRKKLVVYINPPYAEAANKRTVTGNGENKVNVAVGNQMYHKYIEKIGIASRELFAQFFIRIYHEIPTCKLAEFSKLKILQAPNFRDFRQTFRAKLGRNFIVPADTFDNVKGDFPIGFFIWHLDGVSTFAETYADVYDADGEWVKQKYISCDSNFKSINDWIITTRNRQGEKRIGFMSAKGADFQNANYNYIINDKSQLPHPRGTWVTTKNICETAIYLAVRKSIPATWLNDRDLFLYPNDEWKEDKEFQSDCLAYTLFNNNIQSIHGINHWIPFTEEEAGAQDNFDSHFMSDFIHGKLNEQEPKATGYATQTTFIETEPSVMYDGSQPVEFSPEATKVLRAGQELWRYYHSQPDANPNASFYDIRLHFQGTKTLKSGKTQMNPDSSDPTYTNLISQLRAALRSLAERIEPKVYEYGFLL